MTLGLLRALAAEGGPRALCVVMQVKGSAPRHAGSMMLAGPDGVLLGSVGGGRGEAMVLAEARRTLASGLTSVLEIDMQGMEAEGPDMVCGGNSRILVLPATDPAPYRAALDLLGRGERALLALPLGGGEPGVLDATGAWAAGAAAGLEPDRARRALDAGHPLLAEPEGLFLTPLLPQEKLLILGGGHVGRALAQLAPGLGFQVTVADDRDPFLEPGRFPAGVATRGGGFTATVEQFPFDAATYVVIVSRGHLSDLECVRAVLGRTYRYAGFMGSLRKVRLVLGQVEAEGRDPDRIAALCAPIGLEIEAETPEELAVAIAGELIAVRRGAPWFDALHEARKARRSAR